jgi:hypothetical protein
MKISFLFLFFLFFGPTAVLSQGIIRGKITDEKGETMIGVRIFLKENKTYGVVSDLDGNYSIKILQGTPQTIIISYNTYEIIEEIVNPLGNEVLIKDFNMKPFTNTIQEVKVSAKQIKGKDSYVERLKINSATSIDYISSEIMKKTGDPNVTAAVSRVSGVSTNGGLITVRGIGDRYVKTTLNGLRIPTLDPLTNNIKLDIFPASLVDNIIITKTASPDLPGDWSGAYISAETKDYPGKLEVNVESQFGYNEQTTFKEVLSTQRSSTDWLGFDNGLRNSKDAKIESAILAPTTYQEMVALGLEPYYKSLGVSGWIDGSSEGNTYFKLGLVELGILPKALFDDATAITVATNEYNATYKSKAFNQINPEGKDFNNGFANNWNSLKRKAPINFSQSFSLGNQVMLFGKPLGYLIGFRYGSSVRYDPNGISQRVGAEETGYIFDIRDNAQISRETNSWSALCNLAYKFNEYNKISILYMPNFSGTNDVADFITKDDNSNSQEKRVQKNQFYEQRNQQIYQLKSEHFIPKKKIKIEFNSSYTRGKSIAPDFKVLEYNYIDEDSVAVNYQFSPSAGDGIRRYFRNLSENIFDSKINMEIPLGTTESKLARKLKFGSAFQKMNRKSDMEEFLLRDGNVIVQDQLTNDDIDTYLNPNKFIVSNQLLNFYYLQNNFARDHTFGSSSVLAGFGMLDFEITKFLRFSSGLRVEQGKIFSDVDEYDEKGYANGDLRRVNLGGFASVNAADINETNFLPSINIILKSNIFDSAQTNFRLNYSQTVARPSIRELNDAAIYDNEFRTLIYGNSDLKIVHIKNYDFRAESYFKSGDNLSLSFFYKDFKNHIEMGFGSSGVTWQNIDKSSVIGIELEGKKIISKYFEMRVNATFVKSNSTFIRQDMEVINGVKTFTPLDTINRQMFGQAPYILNGIFSYNSDKKGLTLTTSYNVQGPRLVITGVVKGRPDVYEIPRHSIDFKVSKTLGKFFKTSLTIRDILNAPVRRAYILPEGYVDFDRFRYGTNFILGISYKL